MSLLDGITLPGDIKDEGDFLGGFTPFESGLHKFNIELAYLIVSPKGAKGLSLVLKEKVATGNGRTFKTDLYYTSGTEKGGLPFWTTTDGEKRWLPGYTLANSLCQLITGKQEGLNAVATAKKTVAIYNRKEQKEMPTEVDMAMDLIGKDIVAGMIINIVDKNVKDASGKYVPSGETRQITEIDKFFRMDGMTFTEVLAGQPKAVFIHKWAEKWKGQTVNKAKGATNGPATTAAPVAPAAADAINGLFA